MKNQLNDMMNSLKEKDQIIKEQNTKLSQYISPGSSPQANNLSNLMSNGFQYSQNGYQQNVPQQISNNQYPQNSFSANNGPQNTGSNSQNAFSNPRYLNNNYPYLGSFNS